MKTFLFLIIMGVFIMGASCPLPQNSDCTSCEKAKSLWSATKAYVRSFYDLQLYKIDEHQYQSGNLNGVWFGQSKVLTKNKIDVVIDLSPGLDPAMVLKVCKTYVCHPLVDKEELPVDMDELWAVAVFGCQSITMNQNVLVHCSAGFNRSGLMNGMILYLRGYRGKEIVDKVQAGRPGALYNKTFYNFLLELK